MTWRALHPTIRSSESLASVSHGARWLWAAMVALADDWGCLAGSATKIKTECVPGINCALADVRGWLDELKQAGRIERHRNGVEYIELTDWDSWQPRDLLRRRTPSRLLHPDGVIPKGEERPHDKRYEAGGERVSLSAQPSPSRHFSKVARKTRQDKQEGTSLKRSPLVGAALPNGSGNHKGNTPAERFVRNAGWHYPPADLAEVIRAEYSQDEREIAALVDLARELQRTQVEQ